MRPICGNYLLARKGNDYRLEMDWNNLFIVYDNHKDLQVWRFPIPQHDQLSLCEIIDAFNNVNAFRGWLMNKGIQDEVHDWMR